MTAITYKWLYKYQLKLNLKIQVRHRWLMPAILATQEAKIWRMAVQTELGQTVCETLS
jgi:hypothetical protein